MLFGQQMRGYLDPDALLIGFETRTSSPVRIPRDADTLEHPEIAGLFPCAEGAGYAGGIRQRGAGWIALCDGSVRKASRVNGFMVARRVLQPLISCDDDAPTIGMAQKYLRSENCTGQPAFGLKIFDRRGAFQSHPTVSMCNSYHIGRKGLDAADLGAILFWRSAR